MLGAIIVGFIAGTIGRFLIPDAFNRVDGVKSWVLSTLLGLAGAFLGWLIFAKGLGWGDDNIFDLGSIFGAIIGVIILLPIVGFIAKRVNKDKAA